MKKIIFFTLFMFFYSSSESKAQVELIDRQVSHCYYPPQNGETHGGCTVTLEQNFTDIIDLADWELHVTCVDEHGNRQRESWGDPGVYTGSACGGAIGYGGGSSGSGRGGGGGTAIDSGALYYGGVNVPINYGPPSN